MDIMGQLFASTKTRSKYTKKEKWNDNSMPRIARGKSQIGIYHIMLRGVRDAITTKIETIEGLSKGSTYLGGIVESHF